nr:protein BatD [Bacteroidota bacterium]
MKKIILILASIVLFSINHVMADNAQLTATAKTVVRIGEQFQLQYSFNAEGTGFQGPRFSDFQLLTGPNPSTQSSVQIINGKVNRNVSYTFTYILRATKEGSFNIPAASITYNGKKYTSNTLTIKVVKGSTPSASNNNQKEDENDVFIRAYINNTTPVQGEQIIITYKLFTSVHISNIDDSKISSFKGFWAKNLFGSQEGYPQSRETINGKEYIVAEIKKFALFPQRSGEITIEPGEITCVAQIKSASQRKSSDPFFDSFFNDPFFNSRYQNIEKQLLSNSLKIDVKPLPTKDKPADFSGAVGSFTFTSEIDRTEVKANEAITLKYSLKGRGNIELIDAPNVTFPPDFEVYDPEIKNSIRAATNGVSGSRTFEYLVIPRNPGDYTINSVAFSYYDVSSRKYVIIPTPEYKIKVERNNGASTNVTYSGVSQEDIQYIGRDIRHIKESPQYDLHIKGRFFFKSGTYFLFLIIPMIMFIVVLIIRRNHVKRHSNVALMKTRKATKVSKRRLKTAHHYLKENKENEFYVEISKALWGYLSDKFNIPRSELSMDNVKDQLVIKAVNDEMIHQFINTLNNTEYARFAPGDKSENMDNIYNEALIIISKIERELK